MREILFRGKALESYKNLPFSKNGWVYGYYVEAVQGVWHLVDEKGKDITEYSSAIFTNYSSKQFGGDFGANLEGWIFVQPETVGQYTGIDDVNGNEIFEGDIVSFGTEEKTYEMFREVLGLVVNESTRFCIRWFWWNYMHDKFILKETHDLNKYIEKDGTKCLKIFGNTTDNPELL